MKKLLKAYVHVSREITLNALLLIIAVSLAGCALFGNKPSGPSEDLADAQINVPSNASLRLQFLVPSDGKTLASSLSDVQVTCMLTLVNSSNTANPTTMVKKISGIDETGTVTLSFSNLPQLPVMGNISIASGSIGGFTSFRGAMDLVSGDNVLLVATSGSKLEPDVLAVILENLISEPSKLVNSPTSLVSSIKTSISGLDLTSSDIYTLATNAFYSTLNTSSNLTYKIVDTGQNSCYGNGGAITPPVAGAAFYGQDAQISGNQPSYTDNGDGTVTDNVTGLMWVKARASKVSWDDANNGASSCNVGGYGDWRMPTIKELYSLINFNGKSASTDAACIPNINTTYIEIVFGDVTGDRVIDGQDWSANKYVSTTMAGDATVFGVNFIDGRIKGYPQYDKRTNSANTMYVRYVRGNTSYGINSFTDNGNGTVTDNATGLMWSQHDSGIGMNWQDALAWVQSKNQASYLGYSDWRLPNAKELQSIIDYTKSPDTSSSAAIDSVFVISSIQNEGGSIDYPYFWTGTTHLDNMGGVYLSFGRALGYMQTPNSTFYTLFDVHGAGAQRSDPKSGSPTSYVLGTDSSGNTVYGLGPQGDVLRITNHVRLVRDK